MKTKAKVTPVQTEAMVISADMRELYSKVKAGDVERVNADTLANIAGKNLKALAIVVADQARQDGHLSLIHRIGATERKE